MRAALVLLATATVVCAQSPLIEESQRRYDFWLNVPSACGNGGCVSPKCGTGQCQFGLTCGTWAGKANTCCEARHSGDTLECTEWKDVLEDFNPKNGGEAATLTAPGSLCADDEYFIISDQIDRTRNHCCPFGLDGVVSVDYGEFLNNLTIQSVRCIPAVAASASDPSTTTGSSGSPASTSTGATGSSTPNAANTLKNIFALAPIAFMALAAF